MRSGFGIRHEASELTEMHAWPREVLDATPEVGRIIQNEIKPNILKYPHKASGVIINGESGTGKGLLASQIASAVESDPEIIDTLTARGQELAIIYITTTTGLKFGVEQGIISPDWSQVTIEQFQDEFHDSTLLLTEAVSKAVVDLPNDYSNLRFFFVLEQPAFLHGTDVGDSFMNVFGPNADFAKIGVLTNEEVQQRAATIRDSYNLGERAIRRALRENKTNFHDIDLEMAPSTMGNRNTIGFARGHVNAGIIALFQKPEKYVDLLRQIPQTFPSSRPLEELVEDAEWRPIMQRLYYEDCYRNRWNAQQFTLVEMPFIQGSDVNHYMGYLHMQQLKLEKFLDKDRVAMRRRYPVQLESEDLDLQKMLKQWGEF